MKLFKTSTDNFIVYHRNKEEFNKIYKEIFINEEYRFNSLSETPTIIDCGSHIGLSILYFKKLYPDSKIIAFEPNKQNYQILLKNIRTNKLSGVNTYNYSLADTRGIGYLQVNSGKESRWTWDNALVQNYLNKNNKSRFQQTKKVKLSQFINGCVDLIKIDIEGMEQKVISEIENKLFLVNNIVMEFHGKHDNYKLNNLTIIENVLVNNLFNLTYFSKQDKFALTDIISLIARKFGRASDLTFIIKAEKTKIKPQISMLPMIQKLSKV